MCVCVLLELHFCSVLKCVYASNSLIKLVTAAGIVLSIWCSLHVSALIQVCPTVHPSDQDATQSMYILRLATRYPFDVHGYVAVINI